MSVRASAYCTLWSRFCRNSARFCNRSFVAQIFANCAGMRNELQRRWMNSEQTMHCRRTKLIPFHLLFFPFFPFFFFFFALLISFFFFFSFFLITDRYFFWKYQIETVRTFPNYRNGNFMGISFVNNWNLKFFGESYRWGNSTCACTKPYSENIQSRFIRKQKPAERKKFLFFVFDSFFHAESPPFRLYY